MATLCFLLHFLLLVKTSHSATNLIHSGSSLSPAAGNNSWKSPSGRFAFGFYQQGNGFAVGVWLTDGGENEEQTTVVWTANRDDTPVSYRSTVNLTTDGKLILWNNHGQTKTIAEFNESVKAGSASMLDSGNFVVYDNKSSIIIWQSFDYPTDTIVGGQRLNVGSKLVSGASASDHSSGRFFLVMQADENLVAYPVNRTTFRASYWSSNTYVYRGSEGRPDTFLYLNETGSLSLSYPKAILKLLSQSKQRKRSGVIYRATLQPDGNFVLYSHKFGVGAAEEEWAALSSPCENKAYCGLNSFCSGWGNCTCFPEFVQHSASPDCYPGFLDEGGCVEEREAVLLSYNMTSMENIEWGGVERAASTYAVISNASEEKCSQSCLQDCNCWAAMFDSSDASCRKYKLPLMYALLNAQNSITAFVKSSYPTPTNSSPNQPDSTIVDDRTKALGLAVGLSLGSFAVFCSFLAILSLFLYRHRAHRYHALPVLNGDHQFTLRCFSYAELEKATDGFKHILGPNRYKGTLSECNRSIAVKALPEVSEGESKFRTEMTAVGRTHHRNLVQLLGFCIEGSKKLLVYEFMNNGSLADLLFKTKNRRRLPWSERVRIALDVARGILYLHEECESRIIHCNIKPDNILLNDAWTAKISDFGLAKLLMTNQSGTYTGAKGTSGYMAPEWQKTSLVTEKADVYSFGAVLLEIICCSRSVELKMVYDMFIRNELGAVAGDEEADIDMKVVERMVKVALLCVQEDADLRPVIKNVILMLEGTMNIPEPQSLV